MLVRSLVLLWCSATLAVAADPPVLPLKKKGDEWVVHVTVTMIVPVVQQVTVNVNGKNEVRNVTVPVAQTVTQETLVSANAGRILDLDGKDIDAKKWRGLLKEGTQIAVVATVPTADERKALAARKAEWIFVAKATEKKGEVPPKPVPLPPPPQPVPPKPAMPTYVVATGAMLKDGTLTVTVMMTVYEQVQVLEKRRTPDGKEVEVTVLKMVPVVKQATVQYATQNKLFQTPEGKEIAKEDLPKRLTDKTVLVIALTDKPLTAKEIAAVKNAEIVVQPLPKK